MSPITSPHLFDELDHRSTDGIDVTLLWNRAGGELVVLVCDTKSDEVLELQATPDRAHDVFNHPYAYAAFRGLDLGAAAERTPTYAWSTTPNQLENFWYDPSFSNSGCLFWK